MANSNEESSNVHVAVRIRPFNTREKDSTVITDSKENIVLLTNPANNIVSTFQYDRIYNMDTTQEEIFNTLGKNIIDNAFKGYNNCIFAYGQTGCFARGTECMSYSGENIKVEHVQIGNKLMGDDMTERNVVKLFRGIQPLYKLIPNDMRFMNLSHTVNLSHILVLDYYGELIELPLIDYLKKNNKHEFKLISTSVEYNREKITDASNAPNITSNIKPDSYSAGTQWNSDEIDKYYKFNSHVIRTDFLRGIIDRFKKNITDKYPLEVYSRVRNPQSGNNNETHMLTVHANRVKEIISLAQGLGLFSYVDFQRDPYINPNYTNIIIEDNGLLTKKREFCIRQIAYDFIAEPMGNGYFYGFMLDGNHRFIGANYNVLRNSGKTHTMMGDTSNDCGLIPRICHGVFNYTEHQTLVEMSYLEIYSEEVRDLLKKSNIAGGLVIRQHPEYGPYVEGLSRVCVTNQDMVKRYIEQGNNERSIASTLLNNKSSRSHAIMTLYITQIITENNVKIKEIYSKVNLVDLAGSEKIEISGVAGVQLTEAIKINKSLSTLGLVISKLAMSSNPTSASNLFPSEPKKKIQPNTSRGPQSKIPVRDSSNIKLQDHIPFRDSKLTWILKESLGGNSKTSMLATISPSSLNYSETLGTLRYALNAKHIINKVAVNQDMNDKLVSVLKSEIETLKMQLKLQSKTPTQNYEQLAEELAQRETLMREREKTWEQRLEESINMNKLIRSELAQQVDKNEKIEQLKLYYDAKLQEIKAEYEDKYNSLHTREKALALEEIEKLKQNNIQLKESLNKNQCDLQIQMRQFINDRSLLTKQIQQLQSKVYNMEHEDQIKAIESRYINIQQKTVEEEEKYNTLQQNIKELNERFENDKKQFDILNEKHIIILSEVDNETKNLEDLKKQHNELRTKFENEMDEFNSLIYCKEKLHTEIINLKSNLDSSIEIAKDTIKTPTIEQLLKIQENFESILKNINSV
jgi:hypothetical protein